MKNYVHFLLPRLIKYLNFNWLSFEFLSGVLLYVRTDEGLYSFFNRQIQWLYHYLVHQMATLHHHLKSNLMTEISQVSSNQPIFQQCLFRYLTPTLTPCNHQLLLRYKHLYALQSFKKMLFIKFDLYFQRLRYFLWLVYRLLLKLKSR